MRQCERKKKEQRLNSSWWTVLYKEENEGGKRLRGGPSAVVIWVGWEHTNLPASHSCATCLSFFIFNLDANISPPGPTDCWQVMCVALRVPPGCARSGWLCRGTPAYVSAGVWSREGLLFFCQASTVCSASHHARWDKFKSTLHVCDPPLAQRCLLSLWVFL